jgi:hypothetical protein
MSPKKEILWGLLELEYYQGFVEDLSKNYILNHCSIEKGIMFERTSKSEERFLVCYRSVCSLGQVAEG